jgi:2-haloacid dehalogenase
MTSPAIHGVRACVFDTYGTLLDANSAVARCPDIPEDKRDALNSLWREKQLNYSWLRSLQSRYADFWQVTGEALEFALDTLDLFTPSRHAQLMELYRTLTPFPEVAETLRLLRSHGLQTVILSNGTPAMLRDAVQGAGLEGLFDHILSADAVRAFKPASAVYELAADMIGLPLTALCFLSSNGWDVYGASAFGMKAVWCNRKGQRAERLPGAPDAMISDLTFLPDLVTG